MADDVDRLYELPLGDFTAARNALAKKLGTADVRKLKKPTVPAWAVNQLARRREVDMRRLLRAGEALESAQREAVAGGDQKAFENARRDEREAVRKLRSEAAALLGADGHPASDANLERIARTLHAGAATEEGRTALREGRLSEELEPRGFEAFAGVTPAPARKRRTGERAPARPRADGRLRKAREEATEARRAADEAERMAEKARRAAERARERAERLAGRVTELEERRRS
ncbi:MAG TPA: hypothetical protein VGQ84_14690 [Gaiellaceae bacterium]|jgi:hypothetical protein|nr:hypothetical protein [Gaiellaceae bacterium]